MTATTTSALVTGASSGIGAATAIALARAGVPVVAAARTAVASLAQALGGEIAGDLHPVDADMTRPSEIDRVFRDAEERLGAIGIVVHSVGHHYEVGWFSETDPEAIGGAVAALVSSPVLVANRALRSMESTGGGVIGLVSSGAADKPTPGRALYGPSKAAVNALVTTLAAESAARHPAVGVFGISPGRVDTPAQRRLIDAADSAPEAFQLDRFTSSAGVADPADVGAAIATLAMRAPEDLNGRLFRYRPDGWELRA